ncbi:MAG: hypothetical protein R3D26_03305 [Cyanobacteriota/Melainabacteria group bacterium]
MKRLPQTALVSHNKDWGRTCSHRHQRCPPVDQGGRRRKSSEDSQLRQGRDSRSSQPLPSRPSYRFRSKSLDRQTGDFAVAPVTQHGELTGYLVAGIKPEAVLGIQWDYRALKPVL